MKGQKRARWLSLVLALSFVITMSAPAYADKQKARELYDRGIKAYNLARFQEAIDLLREAYQEEPSPAFLFNIAQAYRQLDDCEHAAFFYKRYLSYEPASKERRQIEDRIIELDARCEEKQKLQERPPEGMQAPEAKQHLVTKTSTKSGGASAEEAPSVVETSTAVKRPSEVVASSLESPKHSSVVLSLQGGAALLSLGDADVPVQPTVRLFVGYAIRAWSGFDIVPGAAASFTPLPWSADTEVLSAINGALAGRYELTADLLIYIDLGAGVLFLSQLADGNPFTANSAHTTGAVSMLHFRAGTGIEYRISSKFSLVATPFAISLSPPKTGLREDIRVLRQIEMTIGAHASW